MYDIQHSSANQPKCVFRVCLDPSRFQEGAGERKTENSHHALPDSL